MSGQEPGESESEYWSRYYEITAERPAWETVRFAIERFASEPLERPRFAVDLGCGAGRDTRELLRAGWRVLAVDRQPAAIASLEKRVSPSECEALQASLGDLATVDVPACELVNASLSLPFLTPDAYWRTWGRVLAALPVGGRLSAMLFGDRDGSGSDPSMTCPPPASIEASLGAFEIEHWVDREEDTTTALGEPHHLHLIEVVARRMRPA